jgi:hypothetical protein
MKKLSPLSPLADGRYLKSDKFFFNSSKLFGAQITDLYDFIWPTVTAMWNLRTQVIKYLKAKGNTATKEELVAKFNNPADKHVRPNLYRACVEFSWDRQVEDLSKTILINLFAYYESWVENILQEFGINTKTNQKNMQFPTAGSKGIGQVHILLTTNKSTLLKNAFYNTYTSSNKYSYSNLENLLIAYRYFKECRNSLVHLGGTVDQKLADASTAYHALTATSLDMAVKPEYTHFALGDKVQLHIKGVAGLTDILLRIVTTIDAEFLQSQNAESIFAQRIRATLNGKSKRLDYFTKQKELRSLVQRSAFAMPLTTSPIETFLKSQGILH